MIRLMMIVELDEHFVVTLPHPSPDNPQTFFTEADPISIENALDIFRECIDRKRDGWTLRIETDR